MKLAGMVLIGFYSVLVLLALVKGKPDKRAAVCMGTGCGVNALSLLAPTLAPLAIAGMLCISAGALINGATAKNLHISHHIIRLILETAMVWLLLAA